MLSTVHGRFAEFFPLLESQVFDQKVIGKAYFVYYLELHCSLQVVQLRTAGVIEVFTFCQFFDFSIKLAIHKNKVWSSPIFIEVIFL